MKPFKFLRGTIENPELRDIETYATASLVNPNTWTPLEQVAEIQRRIRRAEDFRNQGIMSQLEYNLNRDRMAAEERIRGQHIGEHVNETNYTPFFIGTTRVTRVKPKWWMKIKMFFQKVSLYSDQIFPITILSILITIIVIAVISKILSVW